MVDRGVMARGGHTEAAVDLAKLANAAPVAYICEILAKDGHMARRHELKPFAEGIQMPLISIQDIKQYRYMKDRSYPGCREGRPILFQLALELDLVY